MADPIIHSDADTELMAQHGITCVSVPWYHYKTWRYPKLSDAVAQARREAAVSKFAR